MQTGNIDYTYKNDHDKACFQHNMAYGKYKDFMKRIQSDKVLRNKAFKIASNPKYDGYQRGLASIVIKFIDKISSGSGVNNMQMNSTKQLLENLKDKKFILHLKTIFGV